MRKVFISYARQNKRDVEQLVEHLHALGYETWHDSSLHGGHDWWQEILRRIADCDIFITIISRDARPAAAYRRKFDWAESLDKPVLPVAVEPPPKALPRRFSRRHIVDYSDPEARDRAALRLAGDLAALPPAPPLPVPLPKPPAAPYSESKPVSVKRSYLYALTSGALISVLAGSLIAAHFWPRASVPHLARYTYGDRAGVTGVVERLPAALSADLQLIFGYVLVLGGCACIFLIWAVSKFERILAKYVFAAVVITAFANLFENRLLYWTIHHDSKILVTVIFAVTTIKWCCSLLALGGIPAVVGMFLRAIAAWWRYLQARFLEKNKKYWNLGKTKTKWWNYVLKQLPEPDISAVPTDEWSWVEAYNVPGAQSVIDSRTGEPVQAVCLSGGGVRSACVAMGAMQEFSKAPAIKATNIMDRFRDGADPRMIDAVDYVISVSGGGFSGAARLLAVQTSRSGILEEPLISERFEDGSVEFDHLRRGSSYIANSPVELIQGLAQILKNLIVSMATLFSFPIVFGWLLGYLLSRPDFSFAEIVPVPNPIVNDKFKHDRHDYLLCLLNHHETLWAVAFFAFWALFFTTLAIFFEIVTWQWQWDRAKLFAQRFAVGSSVFALLVLTIAVGLPALVRICSAEVLQPADKNHGAFAATVSGVVVLNYLAAIVAMGWKKRSAVSPAELTKQLSWWRRMLPPGVLSLILVVVTLAVLLVAWLLTLGSFAAGVFENLTHDGVEGGAHPASSYWYWLLGLGVATLWISGLDTTSVSLHPYYRYRLGHAFAVRRDDRVRGGPQAQRYDRNEFTWLTTYGRVHAGRPKIHADGPNVHSGGPKFIFAAAATVTGEGKPAPGLNAVSYVMSTDYIGGPELGWLKTQQLFSQAPPRIKRDLTVMTAVAVSGAAFASAMGRHQKGFEKLLAVSGARLGTWLPNPRFVANLVSAERDDTKKTGPKSLPAIRGAGYFYRELFGLNDRDARLVQVTDGGHYENLGLVEALRRRSRLIFCIDGGGDAPPLVSGLAEAIRLAKYELGVTITFDHCAEYRLDGITPGLAATFDEKDALYALNGRLTHSTVAVGLITYPRAARLPENASDGVLIFAKAVLCKECPQWLLTYAASNPVFPHDPTSDQWFNEGQFAAYTELGRLMGRQVQACIEFLEKDGKMPTGPAAAPTCSGSSAPGSGPAQTGRHRRRRGSRIRDPLDLLLGKAPNPPAASPCP